jgi:hypothetical protein
MDVMRISKIGFVMQMLKKVFRVENGFGMEVSKKVWRLRLKWFYTL